MEADELAAASTSNFLQNMARVERLNIYKPFNHSSRPSVFTQMKQVERIMLHMNPLSWRNNRLEFKTTSENLHDCSGGICGKCLKLVKEIRKITTCKQLELETLGF